MRTFLRGLILVTVGVMARSAVASAQPSGDVWAVGQSNGSVLAEHWNGAEWTIVPVPSAPNSVASTFAAVTAITPVDVWAAGTYSTRSNVGQGIDHGLTEHWNGSDWTVGPESKHYIMAIDGAPAKSDEAWVVGQHFPFTCRLPFGCGADAFAYRWTGQEWRATRVLNPGRGLAVYAGLFGVDVISGTDVWTVGDTTIGGNEVALVERFKSAAWTIVQTPEFPRAALRAVTGIDDDDIWVCGVKGGGNGFIAHWNGAGWTEYDRRPASAITEISPNDVWAVGSTSGRTLVEHWNGSRWSDVDSPDVGSLNNYLLSVSAAAPNDIWAVGSYQLSSNQDATLIEHWDGSSWAVVPSPNPPGSTSDLYGVSSVRSERVSF